MKKIENKGNLVKTAQIGNVTVEFYDGAYAGKTHEELNEVRKRISQTVSKIVHARVLKESKNYDINNEG